MSRLAKSHLLWALALQFLLAQYEYETGHAYTWDIWAASIQRSIHTLSMK